MYTYKIEQAIKAAALLHHDQLRKGLIEIPYITHLVAVLMILRDYTTDENTLVAALLHDTLEDTDYSYEELIGDFGEDVAELVKTLTEPKSQDGYNLPWLEAKKIYANQLRNGREEALMIAAADKIHNFRSTIEEYYEAHDRFIKDFGPKFEQRIEAYQTISNAINNRLRDGIIHEFNQTFNEYKKFILDVKQSHEGKK